jgi:hypothetical protein
MLSSAMQKLAAANHLKSDANVAYGVVNGCFITLCEGVGYKRMYIYVGCHHKRDDHGNPQITVEGSSIPEHLIVANELAQNIAVLAADYKTYYVLNDKNNLPADRRMSGVAVKSGYLVQVNFMAGTKTDKGIQAFIDNILPQVANLTEPGKCMKCGAANDAATLPVLITGEAVVPMHAECAKEYIDALDAAEAAKEAAQPQKRANPVMGTVGAFVGAMLGALVWTVVGMMGYIAAIVGWLIAFLSGKGYDLLGGKNGKFKIAVVIVCVILAVVVGNLGVYAYQIHEVYAEAAADLTPWETIIPESEFFALMTEELMANSEFTSELFGNMGMGLLFAALGCWTLFREFVNPAKVSKAQVLKG